MNADYEIEIDDIVTKFIVMWLIETALSWITKLHDRTIHHVNQFVKVSLMEVPKEKDGKVPQSNARDNHLRAI